MMLLAAFVLLILGAKLGVMVKTPSVTAKITPLENVETQEPSIGVIVDLFEAQPETVELCLATLTENNIQATWFFSTTFAESQLDLINKILERGHEFGLSGTDDRAMDRLSYEEVDLSLNRAKSALMKISEPMPFFYPPSGRFSTDLIDAAFEQGFYSVKGSIHGKMFKGKPERAIERITNFLAPGNILVISVGKRGISPKIEYIGELIRFVRAHELSLVTLSSLVRGIQ